jgi:hypothetical protein
VAGFLLSSFSIKSGPGPDDVIFGVPIAKQDAVTDLLVLADLGSAFSMVNQNSVLSNIIVLAVGGTNFGMTNLNAPLTGITVSGP